MALRLTTVFLLVSLYFTLSLGGADKGKEKTLAIIKPDGVKGNYTEEVKRIVSDSGFGISREATVVLDKDAASRFYLEHSSRSFFSSLVDYMTSGPVLIMVLEKENAVADWRNLIGPTDARTAKVTHPHSIRALCGMDLEKNCVHGSDSIQSAQREISFFFENVPLGETTTQHDEL